MSNRSGEIARRALHLVRPRVAGVVAAVAVLAPAVVVVVAVEVAAAVEVVAIPTEVEAEVEEEVGAAVVEEATAGAEAGVRISAKCFVHESLLRN